MKIVTKTRLSKPVINFEAVRKGQCFRFADEFKTLGIKAELYMKTDYDQDAVELSSGSYYSGLCGEKVIVFDAEVHVIN